MSGRFDSDYYARLEKSMSQLLASFEDRFPSEQIVLLKELVSVNEAGVALEMLSEMLAEANHSIPRASADEIASLAEQMGLDASVRDRLEPLVES